jgi:predicted TIM-barrel fold metal-dependent hydrolase
VAHVEAPLVDSHFHVWTTGLPLMKRAWHAKLTEAPTDLLVKTLDDHGVVFGVIAAASLFGTYNDYSWEAVRKHRRLRATAIIDPRTDIHVLRQMKQDGFVGIRLMWGFLEEAPDLDSDDYRIMLRRIADLDWHIHIVDRERRIDRTIKTIEKAGVKVVVDHLGHFDTPAGVNGEGFKAVLGAVDRGRTWVKLSGGFRFHPAAAAAQYATELVRRTGGERLLWASDWPFAAYEGKVSYADTIAAINDWVPDEAIRRRITGENALRFYFT